MVIAAGQIVEEEELKDKWRSRHAATLSLGICPPKDLIRDGCDYEKRRCDVIAAPIGFMFDKIDGLLDLRVKDETKATESEIRPELPMALNTGVATRIGSTLTWNDCPHCRE